MRTFLRLDAVILTLLLMAGCSFRDSLVPGPNLDQERLLARATPVRVRGTAAARVHRLSVPMLRGMPGAPVWAGVATQAHPLGGWPAADASRKPRRMLLTACGEAAQESALEFGAPVQGRYRGPHAEVWTVDKRYDVATPWEVNELVFVSATGELGVRVGLEVDGKLQWWEWVRLEVVDEGPICRTIRAKGAIPVHQERPGVPEDDNRAPDVGGYPWLHTHNHVRGEVVARCYANGVVELFIRHINGRFFTEGGRIEGVVPVIAFRGNGGDWPEQREPVTGPRRWHWDGASVDNAEAAHLLSPDHPGAAWRAGHLCVYQPYEGVEAMAGLHCKERTGDKYLCRAADKAFPKGMARTVRMVASIGAAPAEVAVYTMPDWWYGLAEDLAEQALLPVRDQTWVTVEAALDYYRRGARRGCFDDGAIPRGVPFLRGEPGWEGETPHAQLIGAYLTGNAEDYALALRSSYHVADVAVDKTLFAVRMHGYEPPAQSLPMQRTTGLIAGWLETGDPYLLETAEAVLDAACAWDKLNWPRRAYGRDAAYIRSLVFAYRYTGREIYLDRAQEALHRLITCQLEDGSFADQGETTGIHAAMALIVKPWMGCIATEPMVDFLAWRDDPLIRAAALRFCRWLLDCRVDGEHGKHWVYQVSYAGGGTGYQLGGKTVELGQGFWHVEYLAKLLAWASIETNDPAFYQAWYEAYAPRADSPHLWDHAANKIMTNLTAQRQRLWQAAPGADGPTLDPRADLASDLHQATVSAPGGRVEVVRPAATTAD